ncbi:MAG: ATP phosphoribosyltransferase regulatory subunit [Clostridia bacterium]|nr:ATP phosphoribosyltransferase regulatory subunit [Clostridia bacterium]
MNELYNKAPARGKNAVSVLKDLYESYGYTQYKMSKFEEYDLYVRNKSFLVSDHIITFTDTDGSLMALKPDVTLSIVKNSRESENGVRKVYYNENVYRVPRGALSFKEIMQAGLECIGEIDSYCIAEVLTLAAKSLKAVSDDYVLDVSHMGIISTLVDEIGLSTAGRAEVLSCVGEKNIHGIDAVCLKEGIDRSRAATVKALISMKGRCSEMLEILKDTKCYADACEMADIISAIGNASDRIRIDFSVTDDMKYYSGIVFKGFVNGIPTSVLSGGRYDNLMKKMGKKSGAIGFAVYLDLLGKLESELDEYDVDVLLLYGDESDVGTLCKVVGEITASGRSVTARKEIPERLRYKELVDMRGGRE